MTPSLRLLGKVNHSFSDSSLGQFFDGGYTEAVFGGAYRPVTHDRFNALLKYTYFYNFPTTGQVAADDSPNQFIQKSHIAALDLSYDLTKRWTIGSKYAYRRGEVSLDRVNTDYFNNDAHLFILRNDVRFGKNWEGSVEGRMLYMPDLDERRSGRAGHDLPIFGRALQVGHRLQLHGFLRRPDGSGLRPPRCLLQPDRHALTCASQGAAALARSISRRLLLTLPPAQWSVSCRVHWLHHWLHASRRQVTRDRNRFAVVA